MSTKQIVLQFQEEVCGKTCVMKGKCIADNKDTHWYLMCPHYHKWKFNYQLSTEQLCNQQIYNQKVLDRNCS